jgi:hypothetical protein
MFPPFTNNFMKVAGQMIPLDNETSISPADWAALAEVVEFLQPLVEGDQATLDNVLVTMYFLVNHYKMAHVSISYCLGGFLLTFLYG